MTTDIKELVKRLRAHFRSVNASGVPCVTPTNPDGEEAVRALEAQAAEIERLRELVFNVAKAAISEWKKEFQRAAQFEAKLAVIEANNEKGKS